METAEKKEKRGKFITFEGSDGAGKTTQMRLAGEYLKKLGFPVVLTREPGGTPLAEKLRRLLKDNDPEEEIAPLTELLLIEAARIQHVNSVIRPALERGDWVLCDRFADSTTAYQGYGRGLNLEKVAGLNALAMQDCAPDCTLLLTLPPAMNTERMASRAQNAEKNISVPDRFDGEDDEFKRAVKAGFAAVADSEPERVKKVDCSGTVEESSEKIRRILDELVRGN